MAEGLVRQGLRPSAHGELAPPPPKRYTGILSPFGTHP
jgi:allantoin racemase